MANFNLTITNEGAAFLANIIATQGSVEFTEMRFSTTNYVGQEATLTEGAWTGTFITAAPSASVVDSTTINVAASFDNTTLTAPKDLYSIGLIGDDGNDTALVAVATTSDPAKISEFILNPSYYAYNFNLGVSSTSGITVTGSMAGALFVSDIVDNLTSSNTNKPLSAKQGKVLDENKADKVASATSGDFAALDATGNLTDSGKKAADFAGTDEMSVVVDVLTAKNFIYYPYLGTVVGTGITWTDNGDGSVTANGTAGTGGCSYLLNSQASGKFIKKPAGTYKLTGCPSGGASNYRLVANMADNGTLMTMQDVGSGAERTFTTDMTIYTGEYIYLYVAEGKTVTNITFYPMLRDARITDSTYVPYAKTNRELTVTDPNLAPTENGELATKNYAVGEYFIRYGQLCRCIQAITAGHHFYKNTNYVETTLTKYESGTISIDDGNLHYVRIGNLVTITCLINSVSAASMSFQNILPFTILYDYLGPVLSAGYFHISGSSIAIIPSGGVGQPASFSATLLAIK